MAEGAARFDGEHAIFFEKADTDALEELQSGGRNVASFVAAEAGLGWLTAIQMPDNATEFRFVVTDESYEHGFRTTSAFDASEDVSDTAGRLGLGDTVVRVIVGKSE